jgi:hypothetical protein
VNGVARTIPQPIHETHPNILLNDADHHEPALAKGKARPRSGPLRMTGLGLELAGVCGGRHVFLAPLPQTRLRSASGDCDPRAVPTHAGAGAAHARCSPAERGARGDPSTAINRASSADALVGWPAQKSGHEHNRLRRNQRAFPRRRLDGVRPARGGRSARGFRLGRGVQRFRIGRFWPSRRFQWFRPWRFRSCRGAMVSV